MSTGRRGWAAHRISPSERLLLRAATVPRPEDAATAWRSFRTLVPEGQEEAGERRLFPLVCRNLAVLGEPRDPELRGEYARCFGANSRLLDGVAPVLHALRDASIPTMALKGAALLLEHYRDMGARPMSDVDILVAGDRAPRALDVLEELGWRGEPGRRWLENEAHAGTLVSPAGLTLDLHRHATYEARFLEADRAFFADATPLFVRDAETTAMGPGDQLLHTFVHGLRWSIARSPVFLVDAVTILRSGRVDARTTVERARSLRLTAPLRQGLELLEGVVGPDETATEIARTIDERPPGVLDRVEHEMRVREPRGVVGALPNLWFAYRRSEPSLRPRLRGFPGFLRRAWEVAPDASLRSLVLAKVLARLAAAARRRSPSGR